MESAAIDYAMKALYLVLMLSMPPIIVASLIGILLSLIQAITQLQEQTLCRFSVQQCFQRAAQNIGAAHQQL